MIPLVIKKITTTWDKLEPSARGFKSEFAKKAWSDLLAYDEIKAANEANLADLLERPYEDIVTEEIIDQLPGPKVEGLTPDAPPRGRVESISMETESAKPEAMDVEGGSLEPGSIIDALLREPKAEEADVKMEDASGQEPSPSKTPRTSSDPSAASSEKERGSIEPESFEDLGGDSHEFKNLPQITREEAEEVLKKQGIWGEQKTSIDPEDIDRARRAASAPSTSKAIDVNNDFVDKAKRGAEDGELKDLPEYQAFLENEQQVERTSPTFALANQKHGTNTGFYHDNGRQDPLYWFKLQHMSFRDPNVSFQHPAYKFFTNERNLWDCMAKLDPVYDNLVSKGKIIFDAGDVRSTVDDDLLAKSSTCAQRADRLRRDLLGKLEARP